MRAALATVNRSLTVGIVSAGAKELTREVLNTMLLQKLTLASAVFLAAGLITWGARPPWCRSGRSLRRRWPRALILLPNEMPRPAVRHPNPIRPGHPAK